MYLPALFGLFLAAIVAGQHVDITPPEAVRRVGESLEVLCRVSYPIDSCRMQVGTQSYRLKPEDKTGDVIYHGQGLQVGECGATIKNIHEEWNGNISCTLPPPAGSLELTASMRLIVARPPAAPVLLSPSQPVFREGEPFEAQCIVAGGRPAARITWFLDADQILVGTHQPTIDYETGTDLQTIKQNLTKTIASIDNQRRLICRAEHQAWEQPRDAARQLIVHYPPTRVDGEGPLTVFGLKLSNEGRLNVTVRSSPPPHAEWTVGDMRLPAPSSSPDGGLDALAPIPVGPGVYNITLVLAKVTKEDVERVYYLRVSNDVGHDEMAVRISTMDEPAGVELDTGAIVGIVVAVLVLLAAIFLIVFAKATDRWCFAGRNRDAAKSSGESSDTESAVGGRTSRARRSVRDVAGAAGARLAALRDRVRGALPRGRDRVQAAESGEEDKPSDEKKGVVYAELSLGEPPAGDKPPPPPTEYAEIVYNEGQKEAKE